MSGPTKTPEAFLYRVPPDSELGRAIPGDGWRFSALIAGKPGHDMFVDGLRGVLARASRSGPRPR